ncbi:GFA family protein [Cystobacter ferrugineus]|uniref:GFA family protein n=1 Tax=Cystobacter ferrugineus TaxID=83449 RepID=UPI001FE9243A|nr:GFA family protein [Cystobacter ferrugineus]
MCPPGRGAGCVPPRSTCPADVETVLLSKCRRWHGHVGAYTAVDRPGFELTEQRGLRWYAASATVRRGFCGECGSSLFWDEEGAPKMSICAGTLDPPDRPDAEGAHLPGQSG